MNDRSNPIHARIPSATYRLQFNNQFTFNQATAIVDYLYDLGITDCYASPLLLARPGSLHCYDVIDHSKLNSEIGTEEEFVTFARKLRQRDMGLMMDIVPNHMCIAGGGNRWWNDVLENGPGSPFAEFFDIDWNPPKSDLINKVLLPVLGEQYGRVLENQEIKLSYHRGAFFAHYYEMRLPIAPRTYTRILELLLPSVKPKLGELHTDVLELESIITALSHLPARTVLHPDKIKERRREKEIIKRRLALLVSANATMRAALKVTLNEFNGTKGDPASFDRLEALLAEQAYRLCYWRVASEEINYRRFFDINELAAIRVEEPVVFAAVHDLTLRLMKQGWVTGLRIDHVDGLFDPAQYLFNLQQASLITLAQARESSTGKALSRTHQRIVPTDGAGKPCYVVAEKILGDHESLNVNWLVQGTTGHDFLNLLNGVFVDTSKALAFKRLYERFIKNTTGFDDLMYECKKLILRVAMSSELHVLARRLDRISEQHRYSRDFTLNSLQYALAELVACFPVYRSYITSDQTSVSQEDRGYILTAIRKAKRRNPATSPSLFDFIGSILLLNDPDGLNDTERQMRRDFVSHFQQLTGPVMAKGLEDTAFYRRHPLSSLNEVGGEPESFGITRENFHLQNQRRALQWPNSLSATSTHDTKRSEDLRARINVLSEIPTRWYHAILRWQNLNQEKKTQLEESIAPDSNEEYLFYQTLIGIWPFTAIEQMKAEAHATFIQRIEEYLIKALREAKVHSSWISPDEGYELALRKFVRAALDPGDNNDFLKSFSEFQTTMSRAGIFNSLSQTLLKIASPGIPDFYQGTELWNFNLVDPDNRRTVDYAHRQKILASMVGKTTSNETSTVAEMLRNPEDGRIKFYLTRQALRFRRDHHNLFINGKYLPLRASGKKERNIIAFARVAEEQTAIVIAGRFFTQLGDTTQPPLGSQVWGETAVVLLDEMRGVRYRDVLTGQEVRVIERSGKRMLSLAEVFAHLPAALLEQVA
ncbi:MAG: malto-oligosyltrehalose synthase [Acidobacteria bacterium]|nr:malto-oligosyltrehalose synthase [Acidobacteriota bacterium]